MKNNLPPVNIYRCDHCGMPVSQTYSRNNDMICEDCEILAREDEKE